MNNKVSINYLILIIAPFFFGCSGPVTGENKNNASASSVFWGYDAKKYIIDTKESVVTWKGSMLLAPEEFTGVVYISEGELMIRNGQLVGGIAEVDMNTIEEKPPGSGNKAKHLKSPDLFDVKKFPVSTFAITKVATVSGKTIKVTGNLTIKGITNAITFPAKVEVKDGIVQANGKVIIDRTDWDISYRSGKFYDIVANQTISDDIEFHINIVAKNKG